MRNPVKSFSIAVHGAVPLKAKINNGELSSEYDLPKAISEALDFYVTWKKRTGTKPPLKQAAEEIDMFKNDGEQLSDSAKKIVMLIADNIRKTRKMSDGIERAVRAINSENEAKLPGTQEHNRNFVTLLDDSFNGLDEPLFQVTNRYLNGNDRVAVTNLDGLIRGDKINSKTKAEFIKKWQNKTFYIENGGISANFGKTKKSGHTETDTGHLYSSSDNIGRNKPTRLRIINNDEAFGNVVKNSIYVDQSPAKHDRNKGYQMADLYSAVTMDGKTMAVKIVARITDGTYFDVDSVNLYDLIIPKQKEGTLSAKPRIAEKLQAQGVPSFKITIAELLKDVKDRKGEPYVVNGKLNYDGNIFMAKDVLDAESKRYEFLHNINNFINGKFHGASNLSNDGSHISFDVPNGNHIEVNSVNNTVYVNPNKKSPNKVQPVYIEDLLTLSKDSINDAISYDALKLAMSTLSKRELSALYRKLKDIQTIGKAYRQWQVARLNNDGTLLGKTFQRISDNSQNLLKLFAENDKAIISKVKEGKVWESEKNNKSAEKLSNILDKSLEEPLNQMVDISTLKDKAKGKIKETVKGKDHNNDHITVREREK